ncbi:MAG: hypothetical protein ABIA56_04630, partial [Actinomycetota bacterium]
TSVSAFQIYLVDDLAFESGFTRNLAPGDSFKYNIEGKTYFATVNSLWQNQLKVTVSENKPEYLGKVGSTHPIELDFDVSYDDYYDINIKVEGISWENRNDTGATLTIKKIHKEIPSDAFIQYTCYRSYTCPNGKQIKQCETIYPTSGNSTEGQCRCKSILLEDCGEIPAQNQQQTQNQTQNKTQNQTQPVPEPPASDEIVVQSANRFRLRNTDDCPEGCTCGNASTTCEFNGKVELTIEGTEKEDTLKVGLGNLEVLTKVPLYRYQNRLYGYFNGTEKEITIYPDEATSKLASQTEKVFEEYQLELKEDSYYHIKGKSKAKLFGIISMTKTTSGKVDISSGEVTEISGSWWGFLATER